MSIVVMLFSIVCAATAVALTWRAARESRIWTVYLFCVAMLVLFFRWSWLLIVTWRENQEIDSVRQSLTLVMSVLMTGGCVGLRLWVRRETDARNKLSKAREAVSASERFLQTVVDTLPAQVAVLDGAGKVLTANRHWRDAVGANDAPAGEGGAVQSAGQHWAVCAVEENLLSRCETAAGSSPDAAVVARGLRDVMSGERETFFHEYITTNELRGQAWRQVRLTRFHAEDGSLRLVATHEDATEVRRARAELDASRQRLAALVRASPLAAIVWDTEFRAIEWNAAAERMFGYTAQEAMGRHASFIIPPAARAHVDEVWGLLARNTGGLRSTNQNITRDNRLILCDWFNATLLDVSGKVIGVSSLCDDITDRVRAEEELRASREEYRRVAESNRRLLSEVNHRVRNNIAGLLSLIELKRKSLPSANDFAAIMTRRIRAMAQVQSLLVESQWSPVGLRSLANSVLDSLRSTAPFDVPMLAEGPAVLVSARRATPVAMVLAELFANSCKHGAHSQATGSVSVSWDTRREGSEDRVTLRWRESGGPRIENAVTPSTGVDLIQGFVQYELGGTCRLQFAPDGVDHTFEFSASDPEETRVEPPPAELPLRQGKIGVFAPAASGH